LDSTAPKKQQPKRAKTHHRKFAKKHSRLWQARGSCPEFMRFFCSAPGPLPPTRSHRFFLSDINGISATLLKRPGGNPDTGLENT